MTDPRKGRFVDMHDQPMDLDAWAALFEDLTARTLHRLVVDEIHELALIWIGEVLPELGLLPWALIERNNGAFVRELAQYPDRTTAERGWIENVRPFLHRFC